MKRVKLEWLLVKDMRLVGDDSPDYITLLEEGSEDPLYISLPTYALGGRDIAELREAMLNQRGVRLVLEVQH